MKKPIIPKKASLKRYNPNTNERNISKSHSWQDSLSNKAFIFFPEKDDWRNRLIYSMYEWAEQPDAYEIMDFCIEYKIPRETLYGWTKQFDDVGKAYANMKLILASRRRKGALKRELDKDVVFKDMHRYDPEWLQINKYHAQLKSQEGDTGGMRLVMMEKFPSVPNPHENDKEE